MAKLKATPKNYAEALAVLAGRGSVRLGNNTYLELDSVECIVVRFHQTDIVNFFADGRVMLRTGGYHTATTKERINQFILSTVYQKSRNWFVYRASDGSTVSFKEGMEV